MSLTKIYNDVIGGDWSKLLMVVASGRCIPSTRPGLGHVNYLAELNSPVVGRCRFFSKQFECNPQRLYFLFNSHDVQLFHSEDFKQILQGYGSFDKTTSIAAGVVFRLAAN